MILELTELDENDSEQSQVDHSHAEQNLNQNGAAELASVHDRIILWQWHRQLGKITLDSSFQRAVYHVPLALLSATGGNEHLVVDGAVTNNVAAASGLTHV